MSGNTKIVAVVLSISLALLTGVVVMTGSLASVVAVGQSRLQSRITCAKQVQLCSNAWKKVRAADLLNRIGPKVEQSHDLARLESQGVVAPGVCRCPQTGAFYVVHPHADAKPGVFVSDSADATHEGFVNVAFADGHVDCLPVGELWQLATDQSSATRDD